jgi:hypothetical protein
VTVYLDLQGDAEYLVPSYSNVEAVPRVGDTVRVNGVERPVEAIRWEARNYLDSQRHGHLTLAPTIVLGAPVPKKDA